MVQQNIFPHEVNNGKQPQRVANKSKAGQPPARVVPQAGPNRQAGEQRSRSGQSQQGPQLYQDNMNRSAQVQQEPQLHQGNMNQTVTSARDARPSLQEGGKVRLRGRIGRYFDVKRTQRGTAMAVFSVATGRPYRDESGNWLKQTVWQRIVVWGEAAQAVGRQLRKGAQVYVEGKLKTREWTDNENILHTTTELVARDVRFEDMAEDGMVFHA